MGYSWEYSQRMACGGPFCVSPSACRAYEIHWESNPREGAHSPRPTACPWGRSTGRPFGGAKRSTARKAARGPERDKGATPFTSTGYGHSDYLRRLLWLSKVSWTRRTSTMPL